MSKRKEKISAFLDNDMHPDALMSFSLSAEADDAKLAQRYQMMGDALRGEMSEASFVDVSDAVREALAGENIATQSVQDSVAQHAAPKASTPQHTGAAVALPAKAGFFDFSSWFKPAAGMAVAASVAVVVVLSVTQQDAALNAPHNAAMASKNEILPVQLAVEDSIIKQRANKNSESDLTPYINHHLEFANQGTLQGRMPYIRAVSFEPADRAASQNIDQTPSTPAPDPSTR